jgi:hypothetical protein
MSTPAGWLGGYARQADADLRASEYPWADGSGTLRSPLDWSFSPSRLLVAPAGRTFLKILRRAIDSSLPGD